MSIWGLYYSNTYFYDLRKWTLWAFMGDLCFFAHTDILWIIAQIYFMDYCTNMYYAILKTEYQKIIINLYIYKKCRLGLVSLARA